MARSGRGVNGPVRKRFWYLVLVDIPHTSLDLEMVPSVLKIVAQIGHPISVASINVLCQPFTRTTSLIVANIRNIWVKGTSVYCGT